MNLLSKSKWYHPTTAWVAMQVSITAANGPARPSHLLSTDGWTPADALQTGFCPCVESYRIPIIQTVFFETTYQMTDPSRWMATQAVIFLRTLIGSTRQCMMKGVPSFL
jgi:hypothetical protein